MITLLLTVLAGYWPQLEVSCPEPPPVDFDSVYGLPPADTGERQVFYAHDIPSLWRANEGARYMLPGTAAVVLEQIIEYPTWLYLWPGVLYTGGGLRRGCSYPEHILAFSTIKPYQRDTIVDSMVFDGNWDECGSRNDWKYDNALSLRGRNTIRNNIFVDSPSETITTCGAVVENNRAANLAGSFLHKSCLATEMAPDFVTGNVVTGANLLGDAVLEHSEGLITFSANSMSIFLQGNLFLRGNEGVFGLAGLDDEGVVVVHDCWQDFPRILEYYGGARAEAFRLVGVTMVRVGP